MRFAAVLLLVCLLAMMPACSASDPVPTDASGSPQPDLPMQAHTVATGGAHTVAIRTDGTVLAIGRNDEKQCVVAAWKKIMAVDAGTAHTVRSEERRVGKEFR